MSDDDWKTEAAYNRYDDNHANGLMFLFFILLSMLNPMIIIMNMNPMISTLQVLLNMLDMTWIDSLSIVLRIVMVLCFVFSILLGIGIYRLKAYAWNLSKFFIPILQFVYLMLIIPGYSIVKTVDEAGMLTSRDIPVESRYKDFTLRLLTSLLITILAMVYLLTSKKGKKAILGSKT